MRSIATLMGICGVVGLMLLGTIAITGSDEASLARGGHADRSLFQPGTVSAEDAFRSLLLPSIPAGVSDLQGEAETFQGYAVYLRFHADEAAIDAILATGFEPYEPSPVTAIAFQPKLHTVPVFTPAWAPDAVAAPECYVLDVTNAWTHDGRHYLLVDREQGVVYFAGGGA